MDCFVTIVGEVEVKEESSEEALNSKSLIIYEEKMDKILMSAIIIGVSLVVMGFLIGGRYTVSTVSRAPGIFVVDRFTGEAMFCFYNAKCDFDSINQAK